MKVLGFLFLLTFYTTAFAADIILNSNNTVSLSGPVDSESVSKVMVQLQALDSLKPSKDPIYLVLNTPGGSIFDGLQLIQFTKSLNRPVHTISIFSASMGFQIAQQLGTRYITEFGELMSHKARGSISGEFPGQLDQRYQHILSILEMMDQVTVQRTKGKQTLQSYRNLYENEYWASSRKALHDGFADEVANVKCDSSLKGFIEKNTSFGPFTIKLKFSKCPTITTPIDVEGVNDLAKKTKIIRLYHLTTRKIPMSF